MSWGSIIACPVQELRTWNAPPVPSAFVAVFFLALDTCRGSIAALTSGLITMECMPQLIEQSVRNTPNVGDSKEEKHCETTEMLGTAAKKVLATHKWKSNQARGIGRLVRTKP